MDYYPNQPVELAENGKFSGKMGYVEYCSADGKYVFARASGDVTAKRYHISEIRPWIIPKLEPYAPVLLEEPEHELILTYQGEDYYITPDLDVDIPIILNAWIPIFTWGQEFLGYARLSEDTLQELAEANYRELLEYLEEKAREAKEDAEIDRYLSGNE